MPSKSATVLLEKSESQKWKISRLNKNVEKTILRKNVFKKFWKNILEKIMSNFEKKNLEKKNVEKKVDILKKNWQDWKKNVRQKIKKNKIWTTILEKNPKFE